MSVFNSLGSNYNLPFVLESLFTQNKQKHSDKLQSYLQKKYRGKVILTYKGREAIELALKICNLPKKAKVGITGFTCFAVWKAVKNAECEFAYLDIDETLNFPADKIPKDLKVLIIQNTLGVPQDIEKISEFCRKNKIILIEDLAHCVGTVYRNGKEAGSVGDFAALSFSQDKVIDAVSGGALIIRNPNFQIPISIQIQNTKSQNLVIDRLYPLLTFKIRMTYDIFIGKLLHFISKKINLLSQPLDEKFYEIRTLSGWHSKLALRQFEKLNKQLKHRRKIAKLYAENLNEKFLSKKINETTEQSSNLRFPIFTDQRDELILHLKKNKIYLSDIWYDAPIAPKRLLNETDYENQCSNAEKISQRILNLPTHINISENTALQICVVINQWQSIRQKR